MVMEAVNTKESRIRGGSVYYFSNFNVSLKSFF